MCGKKIDSQSSGSEFSPPSQVQSSRASVFYYSLGETEALWVGLVNRNWKKSFTYIHVQLVSYHHFIFLISRMRVVCSLFCQLHSIGRSIRYCLWEKQYHEIDHHARNLEEIYRIAERSKTNRNEHTGDPLIAVSPKHVPRRIQIKNPVNIIIFEV